MEFQRERVLIAWFFRFEVNLSFILIEVYLPLCERSERGIRLKKKLKFTQIWKIASLENAT